jgi:peptidoglycan/xylan/chitin deacetylase (PgdA/CDA1 family)
MLNGLTFTFDDGPSLKYTPHILDVLKKHKVKAVFCWPAYNLLHKKKLAIAKRALREGHILCNHSLTHTPFSRLSKKRQVEEIVKTQKIYKDKLNYVPKFFRPPCGVITKTMRKTLKRLKITLLYWDIDPRDWSFRTSRRTIYKRVISQWIKRRKKGKNSIVLFHDINHKTASMIDKIITRVEKDTHGKGSKELHRVQKDDSISTQVPRYMARRKKNKTDRMENSKSKNTF